MNKLCPKCKIEKSVEDFSWRNSHKSRQSWCKLCISTYNKTQYKEKPTRKQQVEAKKLEYRAAIDKFLFDYLSTHPCIKCNETNILTLQFDHLRDKSFNISSKLKASLETIKAEVEKCQILCANCHSIKNAHESNNWKLKWLNK